MASYASMAKKEGSKVEKVEKELKKELPNLILLRGPSGSGKTTIAQFYQRKFGFVAVSADDYFYKDGRYNFDSKKLQQAHEQCRNKVRENLSRGKNVIVHNTLIEMWELETYLQMNDRARITVWRVISQFTPDKPIPSHVIEKQISRYEPFFYESRVSFNKNEERIISQGR